MARDRHAAGSGAELLLVDEPAAGMTDAETEDTADLLREINRSRSLVVVEHDMAFVRSLGARVTVLHEGSVLAEGSITTCRTTHASSKSILAADACFQVDRRSLLRCQPGASPRHPDREKGRSHLHPRPQRRRKTSLLRAIFGLHPDPRRPYRLGGSRTDRTPPHRRARAGLALVPQGREIFARLTVAENLATGLPRCRAACIIFQMKSSACFRC